MKWRWCVARDFCGIGGDDAAVGKEKKKYMCALSALLRPRRRLHRRIVCNNNMQRRVLDRIRPHGRLRDMCATWRFQGPVVLFGNHCRRIGGQWCSDFRRRRGKKETRTINILFKIKILTGPAVGGGGGDVCVFFFFFVHTPTPRCKKIIIKNRTATAVRARGAVRRAGTGCPRWWSDAAIRSAVPV